MTTNEPNLLTTGKAAKLCSVTPDTILKWIKKGRLNGVRTAGGHYRIERRDIEPLIVSPGPAERLPEQGPMPYPQSLRCWEYLSDRGAVRNDCRECVVYRVRAARCFLVAGLEPDVGHARQFCHGSCEDCVYYRRLKGLSTKVLVITSDDEFMNRLANEENDSIALRFARNGYDASAIIHDFRPAFAAIDTERIPQGDTDLLDSLASDPRVPGLRVILVVPPGMTGREHRWPKSDLIVSVIEKRCGIGRIAMATDSLPVERIGDSRVGDPPASAHC